MPYIALLWQATGNNENAKLFFQASAFYRKRQGWPFSEELHYVISTYEIDVDERPNVKLMQSISSDYVKNIEGKKDKLEGQVENILSHGGSGFIKPSSGGSNVYFSMKDIIGRKTLIIGDKVEYELTKGKDEKIRAMKITLQG